MEQGTRAKSVACVVLLLLGLVLLPGLATPSARGSTVQASGAAHDPVVGSLAQRLATVVRDGSAGEWLGFSVAISGDTVVVGVPGDDNFQGSAYVFIKPPAGWTGILTETARLIASNGEEEDGFGSSVSISGDTVVVGAPLADVGDKADGLAYLFRKPAGGWTGILTETAILMASDSEGGESFGSSVAIDQDTVVVGAYFAAGASSWGQGAAYLFVKPPSGWAGPLAETAKLIASDGELTDSLGSSVAVSGETVVVGAPWDDIGDNWDQGSAYLFVKPVGGWAGILTEDAKLTASDGASDQFGAEFGNSVATDGGVVIVGAWYADVGTTINCGAAYVYVKPPAGWAGAQTEDAKLTASDEKAYGFGTSVAVDGEIVVVGVPAADVDAEVSHGVLYLFNEPPAGWAGSPAETALLTALGEAGDSAFGTSVAIDGDTVVGGAPWDDIPCSPDQGAAYAYVKPPAGWVGALTENAELTASVTCWTVYAPLVMRQW